MTRLRILHVIPTLRFGGAERMLEKVVTSSDKDRFDHRVVSLTDIGPIGKRLRVAGISVIPLGMTQGRPTPAGLRKTIALIRRWRPDLIQGWMYHGNLLGWCAGRLAGIKRLVWGIRCSDMDLKQYRFLTGLTVRFNAWLSRAPDAIVANSVSGADFHGSAGFSTRRMMVIPNGFDTRRFKPDPRAGGQLRKRLGIPAKTVVAGLVARVDPMKDHETFFLAASRVLEKHRDICFVLIGDGTERFAGNGIPGMSETLVRRYFRFLGACPDMDKLFPGMDLALSTSAFGEGFSNTIGEAMSCGVPCVVTDVGDSARIVGSTGRIVPPKSPRPLADAICGMLEMAPEKRILLGKLARDRIGKWYSINSAVSKFERLYLCVASDSTDRGAVLPK